MHSCGFKQAVADLHPPLPLFSPPPHPGLLLRGCNLWPRVLRILLFWHLLTPLWVSPTQPVWICNKRETTWWVPGTGNDCLGFYLMMATTEICEMIFRFCYDKRCIVLYFRLMHLFVFAVVHVLLKTCMFYCFTSFFRQYKSIIKKKHFVHAMQ